MRVAVFLVFLAAVSLSYFHLYHDVVLPSEIETVAHASEEHVVVPRNAIAPGCTLAGPDGKSMRIHWHRSPECALPASQPFPGVIAPPSADVQGAARVRCSDSAAVAVVQGTLAACVAADDVRAVASADGLAQMDAGEPVSAGLPAGFIADSVDPMLATFLAPAPPVVESAQGDADAYRVVLAIVKGASRVQMQVDLKDLVAKFPLAYDRFHAVSYGSLLNNIPLFSGTALEDAELGQLPFVFDAFKTAGFATFYAEDGCRPRSTIMRFQPTGVDQVLSKEFCATRHFAADPERTCPADNRPSDTQAILRSAEAFAAANPHSFITVNVGTAIVNDVQHLGMIERDLTVFLEKQMENPNTVVILVSDSGTVPETMDADTGLFLSQLPGLFMTHGRPAAGLVSAYDVHRTLLHLAVLDAAPPRESDKALAVLPPAPAVQGDASNRFRSLLEPEPAAARSCWAVGVANDEACLCAENFGEPAGNDVRSVQVTDEVSDAPSVQVGDLGEAPPPRRAIVPMKNSMQIRQKAALLLNKVGEKRMLADRWTVNATWPECTDKESVLHLQDTCPLLPLPAEDKFVKNLDTHPAKGILKRDLCHKRRAKFARLEDDFETIVIDTELCPSGATVAWDTAKSSAVGEPIKDNVVKMPSTARSAWLRCPGEDAKQVLTRPTLDAASKTRADYFRTAFPALDRTPLHIVVLLVDALSQRMSKKTMPATHKVIKQLRKRGGDGRYRSFSFDRTHSVKPGTHVTQTVMFSGFPFEGTEFPIDNGKYNFPCPRWVFDEAKERGYLVRRDSGLCPSESAGDSIDHFFDRTRRYQYDSKNVNGMPRCNPQAEIFSGRTCVNGRLVTEYALDDLATFLSMNKDYATFSSNQLWEAHTASPIENAATIDTAVAAFVRRVTAEHDNVALFLVSDHGNHAFRHSGSPAGIQDSVMPWSNVILPMSVLSHRPCTEAIMESNQLRFTTNFDVYATLRQLVHWPAYQTSPPWAFSWFQPIPADRNCEDSLIHSESCNCKRRDDGVQFSTNGQRVQRMISLCTKSTPYR